MATALSPHPSPSSAATQSSPLCHGTSAADWQAAHDALKASDTVWPSLAFDGIQHDGGGGLVEHRCCPQCGSTISRAVTPERAQQVCERQTIVHEISTRAIAAASRARALTYANARLRTGQARRGCAR